ncbi:hypothetical protein UY3_14161 [Chelonia mydas]|uniref:Uncharacterized protein n=1 Tax=Chelonia mydas TaxID=8469 RepID=M7AVN0_CHEMY|nr:hypothetical protein UY3_14161 [Chelonia mydas]
MPRKEDQLLLEVVRGAPGAGNTGAVHKDPGPHHHHPDRRNDSGRTLKDSIRCHYAENLKWKRTRARCLRCPASGTPGTTSSPGAASPGSPTGGSSTGPDSTVPLKGAIHHGNRDKHRRKCGYANKTLPQQGVPVTINFILFACDNTISNLFSTDYGHYEKGVIGENLKADKLKFR